MRSPLLLGAALFTLACGVQAQSTTPESYSDYLRMNNQIVCEARLRCCGSVCSDLQDPAYLKLISRTLDYLEIGLIGYDSAAATTCLASLAARYQSCNTAVVDLPPLTGCDKVIVPLGQVGSMCEVRVPVCPSDTTCLAGRCTALASLGAPCTGIGCAGGTYCNTLVAPFVCVAYSQDGETCVGRQCSPTAGLVCLPSMVCGAPQATGAPCTINTQCDSGFCDPVQKSCQALTVPQTFAEQLCATAEPGMPTQ